MTTAVSIVTHRFVDRADFSRTEHTLKVLAAIYAAKSATGLIHSLLSFLIDAWAIQHQEARSFETMAIIGVIVLTLCNTVLFYLALHVARSDRIGDAIKRMAWVLAGMTFLSPISILVVWVHIGLPDPASVGMVQVTKGMVSSFIDSLLSLFLGIWMIRCLLRLRRQPQFVADT